MTLPSLNQLYTEILADLQAEFGVSIPVFGKSFLRAIAMVQAAKLKLYYLSIGFLQKNIFIDTADSEAIGGTLERFGRVKLNRSPFEAVQGKYTVTVTGTAASVIPAQTIFKSNDTAASPGKLFTLDDAYTMTGTSDSITIRALEAGTGSKLVIGNTLTLTAPLIGIDAIATVTAETVLPLAAESLDDYRKKALQAYRLEPQGGAATDYRLWAADAQGVAQSYPYAKSGAANEINLYVEATIADSTDGKGTPDSLILQAVADVVEFDPDTTKPLYERGRRPLGVYEVNYLPITVKEIDVEIAGYINSTPAIELSITTALTTEISKMRPFIAACDILDEKNDILDTNRIISIILNARPGSVFGAITLKVDNTTMSTYTFLNGNIPHVNSISFV